jgi:hypothetical protein
LRCWRRGKGSESWDRFWISGFWKLWTVPGCWGDCGIGSWTPGASSGSAGASSGSAVTSFGRPLLGLFPGAPGPAPGARAFFGLVYARPPRPRIVFFTKCATKAWPSKGVLLLRYNILMLMTFRTFRTRGFAQTVQAKCFERSLGRKRGDLSNLSKVVVCSKRFEKLRFQQPWRVGKHCVLRCRLASFFRKPCVLRCILVVDITKHCVLRCSFGGVSASSGGGEASASSGGLQKHPT